MNDAHQRPAGHANLPMAERRHLAVSVTTRAVVSLLVVAGGAFIFRVLFLTRPQPPQPQEVRQVREVRIMRPAMVPVRRQWIGYGAARAMDAAAIPAQVNAIVIEVPESIRPGARVDQGSVIARLDAVDFEQQRDLISEQINAIDAELEQLDIEEASWGERLTLAQSEETVAADDVRRFRELLASGDATQVELDRAEAALAFARRAVSTIREEFEKAGPRRLRLRSQRHGLTIEQEIAQRNIDRATILSPIAGTLDSVDVDEGEQVIDGQTVATVVDLSRIEVEVRLPASARLYVRPGDSSEIIPAGVPDRRWTGRIARIGPSDDQDTRTFPVYIEVEQDPAEPGGLTPGLFVQASVESTIEEMRMLVPRQALSRGRLLLVTDGRIEPREVEIAFFISGRFPQLGLSDERYWAALAQPLPEGSEIVVNGSTDLAPGALVAPILASRAGRAVSSGGNPGMSNVESGGGGSR